MKRLPVVLCRERESAARLQERLVAAGFAAEVQQESWLQRLWFVSPRKAGVAVTVPSEQTQAADQKLGEWSGQEGQLPGSINCPQCGSFRVTYPQYTPRSVLTNLIMGFAAAIGIVERDYYCEVCHYTWPRKSRRPRHERAHATP